MYIKSNTESFLHYHRPSLSYLRMSIRFVCSRYRYGAYCFCPVCLLVCLRSTFKLALIFKIIQVKVSYLTCICISWNCAFRVQTCHGQGHPSRSKVKFIGQITKVNICHNIWTSTGSDFIIGMHMYFIKLHI